MKSLVQYIKEAMDGDVFVIYDQDGTIVNVSYDEAEAKRISKEYADQNSDNKPTIKKEKASTIKGEKK